MIFLEAQYFKLNKILLQGTGLWPFQQSKLNQFQFIVIWIILVTATICQITTFVTSELTPKFALKVSSCILFFIKLIMYYSSCRINIETLKDTMEQLHCTCTKLRDKNEIAIIQQYGWKARRYVAAILVLFFSVMFIFIGNQIAIVIFADISPINGSRLRPLQIAVEYFIDQQKYYYLFLLHMNTAIIIGILSFIASAMLFLAYFQHICGMFRIASYRIEYAIEINMLKNISSNGPSIYKKLVYAIYIHRDAMRLSNLLISTFNTLYLCMAVLLVITLSLNLFQIFQIIITSANDIADLSYPIVIAIVMILHLYFANLFGQYIIDHNNEVYTAAYNIRWYMCPLYVQKLILLLLQRRAKEFQLTVGGLFTGSFDCLATQMKATISYFTVMYSTR